MASVDCKATISSYSCLIKGKMVEFYLFRENTMRLFVLTPFNPKWPTAHFKKIDRIIVRAASAIKARQLVNAATFNTQKSKIGQIHNPWQNPSFSKCDAYEGSDFTNEGEEEILFPADLRDYAKQFKK